MLNLRASHLCVSVPAALAGLMVIAACSGPGTADAGRGARVFAQKCRECHGQSGEGVAGKYAEALYGDWPLPKLTDYIARNMPDDHPESLAAGEAAAVAQYVYDSFYSPAAQARVRPARVELSRLTNRQYAVMVADLLRGFGGPEAPDDAERGLRATYYSTAQRGRFDAGKVVHQGVEAAVDLEFTEGSAARARVGAAEFSAQWRGSLQVDETGDYEIVVRTPNSVRVWVNADLGGANPAEAIIDVNVSTPQDPFHRATVRLLGGRRYPLGIDYWALPGKAGAPPPAIALRWKTPRGVERLIPARHLRAAVVPPTLVIGTRFPADDSSLGYERSGAVSKAWDEATTQAAFEVAGHVVRKLNRLAGTSDTDAARGARVQAFAARFVAAAFRRPLTADEEARYVAGLLRAAPDLETGVRRVVLLALKSPHFLYAEPPAAGPDARSAARLALGLWDSAPDAPLQQAAAAGRVHAPADVAAQARRMVGDSRTRAKLREFFHHWLQIRYVDDLGKDAQLYPGFTPEVVEDLRTSLNVFLDDVAWSEGSDFRQLLRAEHLFVNERLARFYGLPPPAGGDFERVAARPDEVRSGVLTHPYLLAALSYKSTSSPIHRGVFLTRSIVGRALKSPPMAVAFNEEEFPPGLTMREKVVRLTRSDTCQGCHAVINPLGFSLEWYDAVGRFRREENGRAVDAASDYLTDDNRTVRLRGARDVAEFALGNERAIQTFVEQLFHHVVKQPARAYGPGTLAALRNSFIASGYNLQKLLAEIAVVSALHGGPPPAIAASPSSTPRP